MFNFPWRRKHISTPPHLSVHSRHNSPPPVTAMTGTKILRPCGPGEEAAAEGETGGWTALSTVSRDINMRSPRDGDGHSESDGPSRGRHRFRVAGCWVLAKTQDAEGPRCGPKKKLPSEGSEGAGRAYHVRVTTFVGVYKAPTYLFIIIKIHCKNIIKWSSIKHDRSVD